MHSMDAKLPLRMATAMLDELIANAHKGGWEEMTPGQLLARARQELGELERAIKTVQPCGVVWSEAADICNFLAMVAAQYQAMAVEAQEALDSGTT